MPAAVWAASDRPARLYGMSVRDLLACNLDLHGKRCGAVRSGAAVAVAPRVREALGQTPVLSLCASGRPRRS
jgi:hypothetical protein